MPTDSDPLKPIPLHPVTDGMPRRVALQVLLGGVGAGFALPATADAQHPMHQHLSNPAVIEQAQQRAAVTASTRGVPRRPSVEDARGPRRGDRPRVDRRQGRAVPRPAARGGVGRESARVSRRARRVRHGRDHQARQAVDRASPRRSRTRCCRQASTADAKTSALRGHFENLKDWIAGAYYSSETGMRELGWTGNVLHRELPGCTHPGGHQD